MTPDTLSTIEINAEYQLVLEGLQQTQDHFFVTGKAGTGKSTLLRVLRQKLQKAMVILAPTGIAALNVEGETIHSFFWFDANITVEKAAEKGLKQTRNKLLQTIDLIVLDEISMVRADLLDCIDVFLKAALQSTKPFGGKQLLFIGDLYQLPPIVTKDEAHYFSEVYKSPYFFAAQLFMRHGFEMTIIELTHVYRQQDQQFINFLAAVRKKELTAQQLTQFNQQCFHHKKKLSDQSIYLTTTNRQVDDINKSKLATLTTAKKTFLAEFSDSFKATAPTDIELDLKVGAQVMFLNNDSQGRWVNGTIGHIKTIDATNEELIISCNNGNDVEVKPYTWTMYRYVYNASTKQLNAESVGSFTQFPIRLAWAITIHKSQGKTFDHAYIDLSRGTFTAGQAYVALSRCRSMDGLCLKAPLRLTDIKIDTAIHAFFNQQQHTDIKLVDPKTDFILTAISKKQSIIINYVNAQDVTSTRKINPLRLIKKLSNGTTHQLIYAFCHQRQTYRGFRFDRIIDYRLFE